MDGLNDEDLSSTAREGPISDEKANLEREKLRLAAQRHAFEREKESEWATIEREKKSLNEEKTEITRLKQHLNSAITEYFYKKAEIQGGLLPSSSRLNISSPFSSRREFSAWDDTVQNQLGNPPLKRKRGRPRKRNVSVKLHEDCASESSYPTPVLESDLAHDEDGQLYQHSAIRVTKKKRGQPRLNKEPLASSEIDDDSIVVNMPAGNLKKRGRKKVYHFTKYGTKLPLVHLAVGGAMMDAEQIQEQEPDKWENFLRFVTHCQIGAPFRLKSWMEKKSNDCLASYVELGKKSRWSIDSERLRSCRECRKSGTPCIVLDATATLMILLPSCDDSEEPS